jgi:hypothetical protein
MKQKVDEMAIVDETAACQKMGKMKPQVDKMTN